MVKSTAYIHIVCFYGKFMKEKNLLGILVGIVIILTVILLIGLSNNRSTGNLVKGETIEIGAPLPLTGDLASLGQDIRQGFEMAVSEINEEKDFDLVLIYDDTKSEQNGAFNSVSRFIEMNKINILLGPIRSGNILAVAPITEENKIIILTPIASSLEITDAGDYIFRNRETSKIHGERMANFLIGKNIDKVAVFGAQASNSLSYKDSFINRYSKIGEIVLDVEYDPKTKDFKTDITRAMDNGAEAVYLAITGGVDAAALARQLREQGFEGIITGSNAIETDEFLVAGSSAEGVYFTSPAFDIENPNIRGYREKYKSLYGEESSAFAANAYDAVYIVSDAIESCRGDDDTDCIRDYLYSVRDYLGIGGTTTFDKNGDVVKPVSVKVVKDGKFVVLE